MKLFPSRCVFIFAVLCIGVFFRSYADTINIALFPINPSCHNTTTGSITTAVVGGAAPYTFSWKGPNGFSDITKDIKNLLAGTYTLTLTDSKNNTGIQSVTLTQPPAIKAIPITTNIYCNDSATGAIQIIVSGGTGPLSFKWSGPNSYTSSTKDLSNLPAGTYRLELSDSMGCISNTAVPLTQAASLVVTPTITDVTCNTSNTGSITLNLAGGTGPYTTQWTTPNGLSTQQNLIGIPAGNYTLQLTDAKGCVAKAAYVISNPGSFNTSFEVTPVSCFGAGNGIIQTTINGGSSPFVFAWKGPDGFTSTQQQISGLKPGTYVLTLSDANGCHYTDSVSIQQPASGIALINSTTKEVSCFNAAEGNISFQVAGGSTPYTFQWTGPDGYTNILQNINALSAGSYQVVVTDANGCKLTETFLLQQPGPLQITLSKTDVSCNGAGNGSMQSTLVGGSPPYVYQWTGPNGFTAGTNNISQLNPGFYSVVVTDSNHCSTSAFKVIKQPVSLSTTAVINQITCFDSPDGAVLLTAQGGNKPYSYSWTGPNGYTQSSRNISGLLSGIYKVVVSDSLGCSYSSGDYVVSEPSALTVRINAVNVSCIGANNGSVQVTVSGATAPYAFSWTGPGFTSTSQNITGLAMGTYHVTITDSLGCTYTGVAEILSPAPVTVRTSVSNVSCNGRNNGSVNTLVNGGTAPYTYSWMGPGFTSSNKNISALAPGIYTLQVTDALGCIQVISDTVKQPDIVSATAQVVDVSCYNGTNGTITSVITGGTEPYSISWIGPDGFSSSLESLSGLISGDYQAFVLDSMGCTANLNAVVSQPNSLSISPAMTNISCNRGHDGTITLGVTGGTGNPASFAYSWTGPNGYISSLQNISGLQAGVYTVNVTDSIGCVSQDQGITLSQPAALLVNKSIQNISCNRAGDGAVQVSISGGTTPYTYLWTFPGGTTSTSQNVHNLVPGYYLLTVTDSLGCKVLFTGRVSEPLPWNIVPSVSEISCYNGTDGSIELSVSGGNVPYTFDWTLPDGSHTATQNINGLSVGTYICTLKDGNQCDTTFSVILTQPDSIQLNEFHQDISCYNGNNGSITLTVAGGTNPDTYNWNGPDGFTSTQQNISGLQAGMYKVVVTDQNNCMDSLSVELVQPAPLSISTTLTQLNCFGDSSGAISLSISGGTGSYHFVWSGPTGFTQTQQNISGLAAGTYTLTLTDDNGCERMERYTLTQPDNPLTAFITPTHITCHGIPNGSLELNVNGGTPSYQYAWTGTIGFTASESNLQNLYADQYMVTVTDAHACTTIASVTLTQPDTIAVTGTITSPGCFGSDDGAIAAFIFGGISPYTYAWSDTTTFTATTRNINGLSIGEYTLTVTDLNQCSVFQSFKLVQPVALEIFTTSVKASCYGAHTGSASVTANGGTPGYSYLWTGPNEFSATTQSIGNIPAGIYKVTVFDAHGCSDTASAVINQPDSLFIVTNLVPPSCYGQDNGSVSLQVSGGNSPYSYSWSGSGFLSQTRDLSNIYAGTYLLTVTDSSGCTQNNNPSYIIVPQPNALKLSYTVTDVLCNGGTDGTIQITVTGGSGKYTYAWTGSGVVYSAQNQTNLSAGAYTLTVTDSLGCTLIKNFSIQQPDSLTATYTKNEVSCYGGANGSITVIVNGGITPYTYDWTGPNGYTNTSQHISSVQAGTYVVIITDANGCILSPLPIDVGQPAQLSVTDTITNIDCFGGNTGGISISVSGGIPAYTLHWSSGQTSAHISNITAGTYTLTVTDSNQCKVTNAYTVNQNPAIQITGSIKKVSCKGGTDGAVTLSVNGGIAPYTYLWSNGVTTQNISGLTAGTYIVTVTDSLNCVIQDTFSVRQPENIDAVFLGQNVSCYNGDNGSVKAMILGGNGGFTYEWTVEGVVFGTTHEITGVPAGNCFLTILDSLGCYGRFMYTILQPENLVLSYSVTNARCFSESNGSVNLTVLGGVYPYSYSWSNGAQTQNLTGVNAGSYELAVTDANGCVKTLTAVVRTPGSLAIVLDTISPVSCAGGSDGSIQVHTTGGSLPYQYVWSGPENFSGTTRTIDQLIAGSYTLTVTDGNNCTTVLGATVPQPDSLQINKTVNQIVCYGADNGSINIAGNGGTMPYTFLWKDNINSENRTHLSSGTYILSIGDANGCSLKDTTIITQPATSIVAVYTPSDGTLHNNSITQESITGGFPPYHYMWNTGAQTQNVSNLPPGNYRVTITDVLGCIQTYSFQLNAPDTLHINFTTPMKPVSCYGGSDGQFSVLINDPAGSEKQYVLTYPDAHSDTLVTNSNSYTFSNLTYGVYEIRVIMGDTVGFDNFTVTQPDSMKVNMSQIHVDCYGTTSGSITAEVSGGNRPYQYVWSNDSTSQSISGLTAGTYSVTVTDSNACPSVTNSTTLVEAAQVLITSSVIPVSCYGDSTGSITVQVSGGVLPYTYEWDDPDHSRTNKVRSVQAGTYTVTVTDGNYCVNSLPVSVIQPLQPLTASSNVKEVSCYGGTDGNIGLAITGGTVPYSYLWSTGDTIQTISGLSSGRYIVDIIDSNGCLFIASNTVTQPLPIDIEMFLTDAACFNQASGSVVILVKGGTGAYRYIWNNNATTKNITGVNAGNYQVIVYDENHCTAFASTTVGQPANMAVSLTPQAPLCYGGTDGGMFSIVTGGTGPYHYTWNTTVTTADLSQVGAGDYSVSVTDSNSCPPTVAAGTITQPSEISISESFILPSCPGSHNGSITASASGGTGSYTYVWEGTVQGNTLSAVQAGEYTVTVTDQSGCTKSKTITLSDPKAVTANPLVTGTRCNGGNEGVINLNVSGGKPAYTFQWLFNGNPFPQTTEVIQNLSAGTYTYTLTDFYGCDTTNTVVVEQPDPIIVGIASTASDSIQCVGGTGNLKISPSGGTPGYSYVWSTGVKTQNISNLTAGQYMVTVTDINKCSLRDTLLVTQPDSLIAKALVSPISCNNANDGKIVSMVSGGTLPYGYSWSTNSNADQITGLSNGAYSYTVTDKNGCTSSLSGIIVPNPGKLMINTTTHPLLCKNDQSGSIVSTVSGGTPPFTYQWNNGQNTSTAVNLAAGVYKLIVSDTNQCTDSTTVTVTQPDSLFLASTPSQVSCNGFSDGSITLSPGGGTKPYSYAWSTGSMESAITGLVIGEYSVIVTDANFCKIKDTLIITQPEVLSMEINETDVFCNGGSTGKIQVNVSGGTSGYTYQWKNSSGLSIGSVDSLTGLSIGVYSIYVTDANYCNINRSIEVSQPERLTLILDSIHQVFCKGDSSGSININISGGVAPYSYLWTNGSTQQNPVHLAARNYTVTVTDFKLCTAAKMITVNEPADTLSASYSITNVNCKGNHNGSIRLSPAGGTAPYTYLWNNDSIGNSVSQLAPGTYSVVVTDAQGCQLHLSGLMITEPSLLTAAATPTSVSCAGTKTGKIALTVGGGTTPYTYKWSNGKTTKSVSNIAAGIYSVVVTDAKGCKAFDTVPVSEPLPLVSVPLITPVSCFSLNDGSIDLNVSGGTTPYVFLWNTGDSTESVSGLYNGTYSAVITDSKGCIVKHNSVSINEPALLQLSISDSNIRCYGGNNGRITTIAAGGTSPYVYSWTNSQNQLVGEEDSLVQLTTGTYTLVVTDRNQCKVDTTVVLTQPSPLSFKGSVSAVSCFGGNNGSITLSVSGGVSPYTFEWSDGSTNQNLSNAKAGVYSVTVTDAQACTLTKYFTIKQAVYLSASVKDILAVSCFGENNGQIRFTVSGGTAPYSYAWNNGSTQQNAVGLVSGTYSVAVTDAHGCDTTLNNLVVTSPADLSLQLDSTAVHCFAGNDGKASVSVSGGTVPYQYEWNNTADKVISTTDSVNQLTQGVYYITITDSMGCQKRNAVTITQPGVLSIKETHVNVLCKGDSNGSIQIQAAGGTTPYTYQWTKNRVPYKTTQHVSGITAGTYTIQLTDSNQCVLSKNYFVSEPDALGISTSTVDLMCKDAQSGQINAVVNGGTVPYAYQWEEIGNSAFSSSSSNISSLNGGAYVFTVTDSNRCSMNDTVAVYEPDSLRIKAVMNQVRCFGGTNGMISLTITGGTAPYSYSWNTGSTSNTLNGLGAGLYSVTITDANQCTLTETFTITQPNQLNVASVDKSLSCFFSKDGKIVLSVTGGKSPYTYLWGNGSTADSIADVAAGVYTVLVSDSNGCSLAYSTKLKQPPFLSLHAHITQVSCYGESNGKIQITPTGGTTPYTYNWGQGTTNDSLVGLSSGTYTLTVTDSNQCTAVRSYTVNQPQPLTASVQKADVDCYGGHTGSAQVAVSGGHAPYTYAWNSGQSQPSVSGLEADVYTLIVTDSAGCRMTTHAIIHQPPAPLSVLSTQTDILCYGNRSGAVSLDVFGGTAPYTYLWNQGDTSSVVNGLLAGTYHVAITDKNQCVIKDTLTLVQPLSPVTIKALQNNNNCYGMHAGILDVMAIGGTPSYQYHWNTGDITPHLDSLGAGIYSVVVSDGNQCAIRQFELISQPASPISLSTVLENIHCFGNSTGSIQPNVSGGTAPYSFLWNTGDTNRQIYQLPSGTYSVIITDALGCEMNDTLTLIQPLAALSVTEWHDTLSCFGAQTGSISLSVAGGTLPYHYNWSNGDTLSALSSLSAGNYAVKVSDGSGCTLGLKVDITQPERIVLSENHINPSSSSSSDGSITISANGGIPPYSYIWNNNVAGAVLSGITAGTYTVKVSDSNHCTSNLSLVLNGNFDLSLQASAQRICQGDTIFLTALTTDLPDSIFWNPAPDYTLDNGAMAVLSLDSSISCRVEVYFNGAVYRDTLDIVVHEKPETSIHFSEPTQGWALGGPVFMMIDPYNQAYSYSIYVNGNLLNSVLPEVKLAYLNENQNNNIQINTVDMSTGCLSEYYTKLFYSVKYPNIFVIDNPEGKRFLEGYELDVYNRWGNKVYSGNSGWDGSYNGRQLPMGTYYYIVKVKNEKGDLSTVKQAVLLTTAQ